MPTSLIRVIVRDGVDEDGKPRFTTREVARERYRGPFADPRPDELARRVAAHAEREAAWERQHDAYETARLARG